MFIIDSIKTKTTSILLTVVSLSLIGLLDYFTTSEFSTSIFYLVPLCFFAMHKKSDKVSIIALSLFATVIWSTCDFLTRNYSSELFPVWNALVRFFIFSLFGYMVYTLKKKEARIMSVNEELLALNNEKNKLIGIAAHDLRNPIGAINSFANILKDEVASGDKNIIEGLNIIKNLSQHSLEMLKNLLDVSVIESGKVNLQKKAHDYIEFVKKQIMINQILANNKKISIELQTQLNSIRTEFDNKYLSEVIDNLLSNAIKYSMPESKINVKISTDKNGILTEVIDEGKGIPEHEQLKLFNYFQKTSTQPTGDNEHSTGLGLAIAKKIVNLHNGEIGVKSILGKGSLFYFRIPLQAMG